MTEPKDLLSKTKNPNAEYDLEDLRAIMAYLRGPQGCPWDKEQTHQSLQPNMIEEAYEALDAIQSGKPQNLCDELGDVLMQVVFHAQIASEAGQFGFDEVVSGICRKLVSRHTHIFAEDAAENARDVMQTWEKNKKREKGHERQSQVLADVPKSLPALQRSYKVQQKAAQVGFDWQDPQGPLGKIHEELEEIQAELAEHAPRPADAAPENLEHEVGDLLFAAVNYARHLGIQPEIALSRTTERFIRRFGQVEALSMAQNQDMEAMSLTQLDRLWEAAKQKEKDQEDDL